MSKSNSNKIILCGDGEQHFLFQIRFQRINLISIQFLSEFLKNPRKRLEKIYFLCQIN